MNAHKLEDINSLISGDEYSIPIDISDILNVCREYSKLTWQMQSQIENIFEMGVEEAIKTKSVQLSSLPYIKSFLRKICENPYFGDSVSQAEDCIKLIQKYEDSFNKINLYN